MTTISNSDSLALAKVVESSLPALSGSALTYNRDHNILLTEGYTSAAGNTYFQGLRLSDRIIVNFDLGQGWKYLFLNGIRVYGYNGREKRLIGSQSFYCTVFNEDFAKKHTIEIVSDYLKGQMRLLDAHVNESQVQEFSRQLVTATETQMKQLSA